MLSCGVGSLRPDAVTPMSTSLASVYLGLGSNQGNRYANLVCALDLLGPQVHVECTSSVYETEPWGFPEETAWFLNLVCKTTTELSPVALLARIKGIEATLGRNPFSFLYEPRPIDIDLLVYGEQCLNTDQLILPHPYIQDRSFVLIPLNELAPSLLHPGLGQPVSELMERTKDTSAVRHWGPPLVDYRI